MMMQMLGSFAEFNRAMVKERTNEGLKAARALGNAGDRKPKLSPTQQREITEMLAAGRSAADLARLFRVYRATISKMMTKASVTEANPQWPGHQMFPDLARTAAMMGLGRVDKGDSQIS
jgi:DNA invertase Pin-like site-specific DNA recombinase